LKGFVPTPEHVVDAMVAKLFSEGPPAPGSFLLDPGCGTGLFIQGVARWCVRQGSPLPQVLGVESDPRHAAEARRITDNFPSVQILNEDFLADRHGLFDYIVGNPPYVAITGLSVDERKQYRKRYRSATGRFDLYLLFFEQAIKLLKPNGRLVFITPEKFIYVRSASALRQALARLSVEEIQFLDETTFDGLVTYPVITTVTNTEVTGNETKIVLRDGTRANSRLPTAGTSWLPAITGNSPTRPGPSLGDISLRISCGVATGADAVYVVPSSEVPATLEPYAFPTLAGRQFEPGEDLATTHSMLIPYSLSGELLPEAQIGELIEYLGEPERRKRLAQRTCVARKPWYAFHENPPMEDILKPKILCKDIVARPYFVVDDSERIVPRHSVYYIVPRDLSRVEEICEYLNSDSARAWLSANCQRAANGFLRLQSHVLKHMPVPDSLVTSGQMEWYEVQSASV
jgi:adenine-specific DNA-methyltransferase